MIRQIILFSIAGLASVASAYVVYVSFVVIGIGLLGSTVSAYLVGMVVGFFINKSYAFRNVTGQRPMILLKYMSLYLFTLVLGASLNLMISESFSYDLYHSFLIALTLTTVINFVGMKFWVFGKFS